MRARHRLDNLTFLGPRQGRRGGVLRARFIEFECSEQRIRRQANSASAYGRRLLGMTCKRIHSHQLHGLPRGLTPDMRALVMSCFPPRIPIAALLLFCAFADNAHAQFGVGQGQQPMARPAEPKRSGPAVPPSEPMAPEVEQARERAKERGVLRAEQARARRIYEIRVQGARKVEPDAVLLQVRTRVGSPPDLRVIQSDVRRIFQMGLFADVQVEALAGPSESVVLLYRVVEKPAIANVVFEGNRDVSKDDMKEVVDLKSFQVVDIRKIRQNVDKIQKLYVDKGFFLAEVSYVLRPSEGVKKDDDDSLSNFFDTLSTPNTPGGGATGLGTPTAPEPTPDLLSPKFTDGDKEQLVDVVFLITENAKVKIEDIVFVGNESISTDVLHNSIRTRENHPLGVFTEWGTYKEEAAEIDVLALEAAYQDKGFINVRVGEPRVQLTSDKTRLALYIPITEGEQYRLESIAIEGELLVDTTEEWQKIREASPEQIVFSKEKLMERVGSKAGELFVRSQIARDIMAVADRYRDKGYAYVNVAPDTGLDEEKRTLSLTLRVSSGPRVRVERIEIDGNIKTQDEVIRREMRIFEGEFYSASALRLSEQRVNALGFFEKVEVTTKQGSEPDRMIVTLKATEKATGTFQLGAGFSNAESFIFTGQIAQNNFLGRGWTLSGSLQWSAFRQILDFRFIDPYFAYIGQEPLTLAFTGYNTQRYFIDFSRNSTGGDVTVGYPIGRPLRFLTRRLIDEAPVSAMPYIPDFENFQLFLTATAERVEIAEQSFSVRLLGLSANVPRYTTSLRGSFIFDQRNNRLFPSQGYFLQAQAEVASPYLGAGLLPPAESNLKSTLEKTDVLQDSLSWLKTTGRPTSFTRLSMTARAYYLFDELLPLKGVVAKGNLEVGALLTNDPTLVFERYFLGGFNTIRGYPLRSIGPVARVGGLDPTDPLQEFRIGGDKQLFMNLELEFPIFEQVGIRGVFFFDAGNAYGTNENFLYIGNEPTPFLQQYDCGATACFDPRTDLVLAGIPLGLYTSVGFGVRWFSPIGPLRFEWGVPLNARPVGTFGLAQPDQPIQFEFNIGQSF